jgi:hypothetical protein
VGSREHSRQKILSLASEKEQGGERALYEERKREHIELMEKALSEDNGNHA